QEYIEKFGEEDAEFLMESEQGWLTHYSVGTYVDTGLTDKSSVDNDIAYTKACTVWLKWKFDRQKGSAQLLTELLDGPWDNRKFLVLEPGQMARMTADEKVVTAVGLPNRQR